MPLSQIHFQKATENDLPALVQLEKECFSEPLYDNARFSDEEFLECLRTPDCQVILALDADSKPLGCLLVDFQQGEEPILHIEGISVSPAARRRGIGSLLLRQAEEIARNCGAVSILLEVHANNGAIKLYEVTGYVDMGKSDFCYADGSRALEFRKNLQPAFLISPARPFKVTAVPSVEAQGGAEIRDATLEVLFRFAHSEPARPGETKRDALIRSLQNTQRLDDVRSAMLAALQHD